MQETQVWPQVRKIPGGGNGNPLWIGESHRQRSLVGDSPRGLKKSDVTEQVNNKTINNVIIWYCLPFLLQKTSCFPGKLCLIYRTPFSVIRFQLCCFCPLFVCHICVNCRQLFVNHLTPSTLRKIHFVSVSNSSQLSFIPHKCVLLWPFLEQVRHFSEFLHILSKRSCHKSQILLYLYMSRFCLFLNSLSSISLFWAFFFLTWVSLTIISTFLYIRRFFTLKNRLLFSM